MKVRKLKHRLLTSNIGKRCKSFTWHCIVCEEYKFLDLFGRFSHTFDEIWDWTQPYRRMDMAGIPLEVINESASKDAEKIKNSRSR